MTGSYPRTLDFFIRIRGLGTAGPGFVVRARHLTPSVAVLLAAHSSTAGALALRGQAGSAASSAEQWWRVVRSSVRVGRGDRPAEAGELTRDGDRDDRLAFAAFAVEAAPELVETLLGLPGDREDERRLVLLAALKRCAVARGASVVPGCLDEKSAGVA